MLENFLETVLVNAIIATFLAMAVALIARCCRRPAVVHGLWLLLLLKLITPPLVTWPVSVLPVEGRPEPVAIPASVFPSAALTTVPDVNTKVAVETAPLQSTELRTDPANIQTTSSFLLPTILLVWFAGSVGWYVLLAVRTFRFSRAAVRATLASDSLQRRTTALAARLGASAVPEVRMLPARIAPMVWRMSGKPVILLPSKLVADFSPKQMDTVLAHELAHLRRRDHWGRRLLLLVLGVYWWHPVVWWARRGLLQAEEQCCDAWVVSEFPDHSRDYAGALLHTIDFLTGARPSLPASATTFGQGRILKRRFEMILDKGVSAKLSLRGRLAVVLVGTAVLAVSPFVMAEEPQPELRAIVIEDGIVPNRAVLNPPKPQVKGYGRDVSPSLLTSYKVDCIFKHRNSLTDEFQRYAAQRAVTHAERVTEVESKASRPILRTESPVDGQKIPKVQEIRDITRVKFRLFPGQRDWMTIDARLEAITEYGKPAKLDIGGSERHLMRRYSRMLQIVENVRLGEGIVVPLDTTTLNEATACVELVVTELSKPNSNEGKSLPSPRPRKKTTDEAEPEAPVSKEAVTPQQSKTRAPSVEEVREAVLQSLKADGGLPFAAKTSINNLSYKSKTIVDRLGPEKYYPQVGPARLHQLQFKCTAQFDLVKQSVWPIPFSHKDSLTKVVYIDSNRMISATGGHE